VIVFYLATCAVLGEAEAVRDDDKGALEVQEGSRRDDRKDLSGCRREW
jgi:hypothetical protein